MGLETGTYISDLNSSNPAATDAKAQGDDHIRLLKSTIKATFPNITGAVTPTQAELNTLENAADSATGASLYVVTQSSTDNSRRPASTAFVQTAAFSAALPAQAGNSGKVVTTNGTDASWSAIGSANQYIRVNAAGTGLEGTDPPVGAILYTQTVSGIF